MLTYEDPWYVKAYRFFTDWQTIFFNQILFFILNMILHIDNQNFREGLIALIIKNREIAKKMLIKSFVLPSISLTFFFTSFWCVDDFIALPLESNRPESVCFMLRGFFQYDAGEVPTGFAKVAKGSESSSRSLDLLLLTDSSFALFPSRDYLFLLIEFCFDVSLGFRTDPLTPSLPWLSLDLFASSYLRLSSFSFRLF